MESKNISTGKRNEMGAQENLSLAGYYHSCVQLVRNVKQILKNAAFNAYAIAPDSLSITQTLTLCLYKNICDVSVNFRAKYQDIQIINTRLEQSESLSQSLEVISQIMELYGIRFICTDPLSASINTYQSNSFQSNVAISNAYKEENLIPSITTPGLTVSSNSFSLLLDNGYSENEINKLIEQGATESVLQKLVNPSLSLSEEDKINLVKTSIEMGQSNAQLAKNNEIILLVGDSGVGKSTVANYLHGCVMSRSGRKIIVDNHSPVTEIMSIGHKAVSRTFIPEVFESSHAGLTLCDCPGFSDNRGPEVNIANIVNIRRVMQSAKSLKIILLISYSSLLNDRGQAIDDLKKTLASMLGDFDSLEFYKDSMVLAVNKVPTEIDGKPVTLDEIKNQLFLSGELCLSLIEQTFIIDPLERNTTERCLNREEWLRKINSLKPVFQHQSLFKTSLNASDVLFILKMSSTLSNKINLLLDKNNFQSAAKLLKLFSELRAIEHPEVEAQYKLNVLQIFRYIAIQEQKIIEMSDAQHFEIAHQKLDQMKQLIESFHEDVPEIINSSKNIDTYIHQKKIERHLSDIRRALQNLLQSFDQAGDNRELIACKLSVCRKLIGPAEPSVFSVSKQLRHLLSVPQINESAKELFTSIHCFMSVFKNHKTDSAFTDLITNINKDLDFLFQRAEQIKNQFFSARKIQLKALFLQNLRILEQQVIWPLNGQKTLSKLRTLDENAGIEELQTTFKRLAQDKLLATQSQLICLCLSYLSTWSSKNEPGNGSQLDVVYARNKLLKLRDKLESLAIKVQAEKQAIVEKKAALEEKISAAKALLQKQLKDKEVLKAKLIAYQKNQADKLAEQKKLQQAKIDYAEKKAALLKRLHAQQKQREAALEEKIIAQARLNAKKQLIAEAQRIHEKYQLELEQKRAKLNEQKIKYEALKQAKIEQQRQRENLIAKQAKLKQLRQEKLKEIEKVKKNIAQQRARKEAIKKQQQAKKLLQKQKIQQQQEKNKKSQELKELLKSAPKTRRELKAVIKQRKASVKQASIILKQGTLPRGQAGFQINVYVFDSLVNLELNILNMLEACGASSATISNQTKRLKSAQTLKQRFNYSLQRLAYAFNCYNAASIAQSTHVVNEVVNTIDGLDDDNLVDDDPPDLAAIAEADDIDGQDDDASAQAGVFDDPLDDDNLQQEAQEIDNTIEENNEELKEEESDLNQLDEQADEMVEELQNIEHAEVEIDQDIDQHAFEVNDIEDEVNILEQEHEQAEAGLDTQLAELADIEVNEEQDDLVANSYQEEEVTTNQLQDLDADYAAINPEGSGLEDEIADTLVENETVVHDFEDLAQSAEDSQSNIESLENELQQANSELQTNEISEYQVVGAASSLDDNLPDDTTVDLPEEDILIPEELSDEYSLEDDFPADANDEYTESPESFGQEPSEDIVENPNDEINDTQGEAIQEDEWVADPGMSEDAQPADETAVGAWEDNAGYGDAAPEGLGEAQAEDVIENPEDDINDAQRTEGKSEDYFDNTGMVGDALPADETAVGAWEDDVCYEEAAPESIGEAQAEDVIENPEDDINDAQRTEGKSEDYFDNTGMVEDALPTDETAAGTWETGARYEEAAPEGLGEAQAEDVIENPEDEINDAQRVQGKSEDYFDNTGMVEDALPADETAVSAWENDAGYGDAAPEGLGEAQAEDIIENPEDDISDAQQVDGKSEDYFDNTGMVEDALPADETAVSAWEGEAGYGDTAPEGLGEAQTEDVIENPEDEINAVQEEAIQEEEWVADSGMVEDTLPADETTVSAWEDDTGYGDAAPEDLGEAQAEDVIENPEDEINDVQEEAIQKEEWIADSGMTEDTLPADETTVGAWLGEADDGEITPQNFGLEFTEDGETVTNNKLTGSTLTAKQQSIEENPYQSEFEDHEVERSSNRIDELTAGQHFQAAVHNIQEGEFIHAGNNVASGTSKIISEAADVTTQFVQEVKDDVKTITKERVEEIISEKKEDLTNLAAKLLIPEEHAREALQTAKKYLVENLSRKGLSIFSKITDESQNMLSSPDMEHQGIQNEIEDYVNHSTEKAQSNARSVGFGL